MNKPRFLILLFFVVAFLNAEDAIKQETSFDFDLAYYLPNKEGYAREGFAPVDYSPAIGGAETGERLVGSAWGGAEAKAYLSHKLIIPALRGEDLFADNNVTLKGTFELSPVSINGLAQVSLSPIAFLVFDAGFGIGTGWNWLGFKGLGINPVGSVAGQDIIEQSFGGVVTKVWGAGTFQFDLAALVPGEWNHIVALANAKFEYKAYSAAGAQDAWVWEADSAENFNGGRFYGTYVLGYQMPLALSMVGLIVDTEEWIGEVRERSTMASGGWGSDFVKVQIGALFNFTLSEKDSLTLIAQFRQYADYTDSTFMARDFRERSYDAPYWMFRRIVLSYSHKF